MKTLTFLRFTAILMLVAVTTSQAQITGTVFRDYNNNGTQQTVAPTNEPGVFGVIVKAYSAADVNIATATTIANGTYSLTGLANSTAYRLEFTLPAGNCNVSPLIDFSSYSASSYGTSVQFLTTSATGTGTASFALNKSC